MDELEALRKLTKAMHAVLTSPPFEERTVSQTMPEKNDGLGISTVQIFDMPPREYETAILDAVGVHPVERYRTSEEARAGHARWVEASKSLVTVIELGGWDGLVSDRDVNLQRVPSPQAG